jgi:ribosomal protein S18 acetylase RimI-like enzyme
VAASAPPAPPAPPPPLALDVRDATGSEALQRACAGMRVAAFYVYEGPASGALLFGDAATRDRDAWLDARRRAEEARGGRMAALGMRVTCLAAVARCDALLPATWPEEEGGAPRAWRLLPADAEEVVGTLDVHVGDRLPGELLEGCFPALAAAVAAPAHAPAEPAALSARAAYRNAPPGAGAVAAAAAAAAAVVAAFDAAFSSGDEVLPFAPGATEPADPDAAAAAAVAAAAAAGKPAGFASAGARAYLFNVCVVPAARRRHVAARLIAAAARAAAQARVRHLYVHVEADNEAARALYARARFAPEAEEPHWLASRLGRPRRLLLRRDLDERDAHQEDGDA